MNRYLKLVHMEVHRFRYMLAGLIAVVLLSQVTGLVWTLLKELARRRAVLASGKSIGYGVYFPDGKLSFTWAVFSTHIWYIPPIVLCIAVLLLYAILIWYRDWIGRDTFIYRLLTLPSARRQIFLAKWTAMLIFVFVLVAFQLALLPVEQLIFTLIVPAQDRVASYFMDVISANQLYPLLTPTNFTDFLTYYGLGAVGLTILFTAVLLERSYRRIGVLYALLYAAVCPAVILLPLIVNGIGPDAYLYPGEIAALELAICLSVGIVSVWLGFRLLDKKITV